MALLCVLGEGSGFMFITVFTSKCNSTVSVQCNQLPEQRTWKIEFGEVKNR